MIAPWANTRLARLSSQEGRRLGLAGRMAVMLAFVAALAGCGGGGDGDGDRVNFAELGIDERNAAASPAVAYESGADLVEGLNRAGVPCTEQDISPVTASGSPVGDRLQCTYAEGDWVAVELVASQSEVGRAYFSSYFDSYLKAASETGSESLLLNGDFWFAHATTNQRLFDTQDALGGQLIAPAQLDGQSTVPAAIDEISTVCQDTRKAQGNWLTADIAAHNAGGDAVAHWVDLYNQAIAGAASSEQIQQLAEEINSDLQLSVQKVDESNQLAEVFNSLFTACLERFADLPPACADEIGQYPAVTGARAENAAALAAQLATIGPLREALLAGDQAAMNAAVGELNAAGEQVAAKGDNWNNTVLPPFSAAVIACNEAIS